MLADAALNTILIADAYNLPLPANWMTEGDMTVHPQGTTSTDEENIHASIPKGQEVTVTLCSMCTYNGQDTAQTELAAATDLYDSAVSSIVSLEEICKAEVLEQIKRKLNAKKRELTSRTAILWLQYLKMIDILRMFLKAERTADWRLHLQAVRNMLPFFAASGHSLYAKSSYIYLQTMLDLPKTHPDVHQKFLEGYHVVRRSNRYWAGLSSDLIIEQVSMRSLKTDGSLTRGRGMTETQHATWLLSMPACAAFNEAMQTFCGISYKTSEQHKDASAARQSRDVDDTLHFISYL